MGGSGSRSNGCAAGGPRRRRTIGRVLGGLLVALVLTGSHSAVGQAQALPTQPGPPAYGPGGTDGVASGMRITRGGTGYNAYEIFEPTGPQPATAPVTVILHGYYELFGHYTQDALIRQTVRKGSIVIYPRYQVTPSRPCAAAQAVEPCVLSAAQGIRDAMAALRADPTRVQPDTRGATYFGLSFGGYLAFAVGNRWQELGVPRPVALLADEPHDGGYKGPNEPTLPKTLTGLPSDALVVCQVGAQGYVSRAYTANGLCNAIFPRLTTIPPERKNVVMLSPDDHGTPPLTSFHALCAGNQYVGYFPVDAYDTRFCAKQLDALRSCALDGVDCASAIGDTPEHRYIGTWSDGVPIIGLKIQNTAPIRPEPYPERAPRPEGSAP